MTPRTHAGSWSRTGIQHPAQPQTAEFVFNRHDDEGGRTRRVDPAEVVQNAPVNGCQVWKRQLSTTGLAEQTFDVVDVEGFHKAQFMCCLEAETSSDGSRAGSAQKNTCKPSRCGLRDDILCRQFNGEKP